MGLHALNEVEQTVTYHCAMPTCKHHNCAEWHEAIACAHHSAKDQRGTPLVARLDTLQVVLHPTSGYQGMIALPPCSCGSQTFVRIQYSKEELAPPIVERDAQGKIVPVMVQGSRNLTVIKTHEEMRDGKLCSVIDSVTQHPMLTLLLQLAEVLRRRGVLPVVASEVS